MLSGVSVAAARGRAGLTWRAMAPQELPLALPLAAAGAVGGLPAVALLVLVLVVEAAGVEVARALPGGEQVPGSFALVDPELARRVLDALPLLQKPRVFSIMHALRGAAARAAPVASC